MVSVITASKRIDRLEITQQCLDRQTHKDWEWVVITPQSEFLALDRLYGHDDNIKVLIDPPKVEDDVYALNKAINAGIKASEGELLVLLQDSIWIPPNALDKFWFHFKNNPQACVSGVGDQYDQLDENGKPAHKVWLDPRKRTDIGTFYECNSEDWETNYASLPKGLIYEIGGWDEQMDKFYAWDNVAVSFRLDKVGAKFYIDQTNESFSLQHGRNPDWEKNNWINNGLWEFLKSRPVKLDYLSSK